MYVKCGFIISTVFALTVCFPAFLKCGSYTDNKRSRTFLESFDWKHACKRLFLLILHYYSTYLMWLTIVFVVMKVSIRLLLVATFVRVGGS